MEAIKQKLTQADELLRSRGVTAIYAFGSRVNGLARPTSDLDLAVLVRNFPRADYQAKWRLKMSIDELLNQILPNENPDVSFLNELPLPVRFRAVTEGLPVFLADAARAAAFKEQTTLRYLDFEPVAKLFTRLVRQRLGALV